MSSELQHDLVPLVKDVVESGVVVTDENGERRVLFLVRVGQRWKGITVKRFSRCFVISREQDLGLSKPQPPRI